MLEGGIEPLQDAHTTDLRDQQGHMMAVPACCLLSFKNLTM